MDVERISYNWSLASRIWSVFREEFEVFFLQLLEIVITVFLKVELHFQFVQLWLQLRKFEVQSALNLPELLWHWFSLSGILLPLNMRFDDYLIHRYWLDILQGTLVDRWDICDKHVRERNLILFAIGDLTQAC